MLLKRRHILSTTAAAVAAAVTIRPQGVFAGTGKTAAMEYTIRIRAFKYDPDGLSVKIGDRITWVNNDIVPHTATAADRSWDTGTIARGGSQTLTVRAGMSADYFCRFHPMMKASIDLNGSES